MKLFWGGLALLVYSAVVFWASVQFPFVCRDVAISLPSGVKIRCTELRPKSAQRCPVAVFVHDPGNARINDLKYMRVMAETGVAVVRMQYSDDGSPVFSSQMEALRQHLSRQEWASADAVTLVGVGHGADAIVAHMVANGNIYAQRLVLVAEHGAAARWCSSIRHTPSMPVLLVDGEAEDPDSGADWPGSTLVRHVRLGETPAVVDAGWLAVEGVVVFRTVAEYAAAAAGEGRYWAKYLSPGQWSSSWPRLWVFLLPAAVWARWGLAEAKTGTRPRLVSRRLNSGYRNGWCAALVLWLVVLCNAASQLLLPRVVVSGPALAVIRMLAHEPTQSADLEALARESEWRSQRADTLLDTVKLSNYTRNLVNWRNSDEHYREFVLSAKIAGQGSEDYGWRRTLWEEFYPIVSHELTQEGAASAAMRHLRGCVSVVGMQNPPRQVPDIWLRQVTDRCGFSIIAVAVLRSVGVASRLDSRSGAEYWNGEQWIEVPAPSTQHWWQ